MLRNERVGGNRKRHKRAGIVTCRSCNYYYYYCYYYNLSYWYAVDKPICQLLCSKRCSKSQTKIPFPTQQRPHEQTTKSSVTQQDALILRGCQNTSPELVILMKAALDVVKDYGNRVKVEFPRYRCLSCNQYFWLASYRKVSNILLSMCVMFVNN